MASFPYDFESNFEGGSTSEWTSAVGTQVSVKSYKELATQRVWGVPYRGAFALHAEFGVDTDSYVRSTHRTIIISEGDTDNDKVMLYIGKDVEATTTTEVSIIEHLPVVAAAGIRIEAGGDILFGIRSGSAALTTSPIPLERGKYYTVELGAEATNGETCTARIEELGIVVTTTNVEATGDTTEARLGIIGIGAGSLADISGTITLDSYAHDSGRVEGDSTRFPQRQLITKSAHAFIGAGEILDLQLLAGAGTDCAVEVYDTDSADVTRSTLVARLTSASSEEAKDYAGRHPITVYKGAYIRMEGTRPSAIVSIGATSAYGSEAALRSSAR